ncbi:polyamine transporter 1 [Trichomonascus vanleenenianus]|uniref:MFS transporter n=1 Tax=Trichomonascus vanleenenianus TaxID=2268995 RepID=UPI003EC99B0C
MSDTESQTDYSEKLNPNVTRQSSLSEAAQQPQNLFAEDSEIRATTSPLNRVSTGASAFSQQEQDQVTRVLTGTHKLDTTPLPKMGGGRDYPPELPENDAWRVDFDGPEDPIFPHNWPLKKKLGICAVLGFTTFSTAWGSSVYASAVLDVAKEFHVGPVVAILGVSLYVMGFASGPILWAPISELYGRKLPIILSMLGLSIFSFGAATGKELQTVIICRFFSGFFGAAPLAVVAAAFSDMFNNEHRGTALTIFSGMVFCGPIVAPVVGGFISFSYLGWRWTEYITGIMAAFALVLDILFYQETYHPIILCRKASELRRRTGNWGIFAPHEQVELDINAIITKNVARPVLMLIREPILLLLTLYTAFIYGILYLFLEAYPIVFAEGYRMKGGVSQLPYLGLAIGMVIAMFVIAFVFEPRYNAKLKQNGGKPVPEARLPPMILGGIIFPLGIFWFTWSGNYPDKVHWICPTLSGLFTGFGLLSIFLCAINYIVDTYLFLAASALAGNTMLRSGFGAAFPLFATAMFHNLGTNWAGTLIGCIGFVLAPVPALFYLFGKRIRKNSKYAFDL